MTRFRKDFYERKRNGSEHVEHEKPYFYIYYKKYHPFIFYRKCI
ncbi:hypothetical protein HMPREF9162_1662 [Selenomonas sp. oral taxon 137 str. F0430]|nr:hypothetical protein HMPREF9162_1662 [Selenomonas sp. oral taxon 137 str. F0430]